MPLTVNVFARRGNAGGRDPPITPPAICGQAKEGGREDNGGKHWRGRLRPPSQMRPRNDEHDDDDGRDINLGADIMTCVAVGQVRSRNFSTSLPRCRSRQISARPLTNDRARLLDSHRIADGRTAPPHRIAVQIQCGRTNVVASWLRNSY